VKVKEISEDPEKFGFSEKIGKEITDLIEVIKEERDEKVQMLMALQLIFTYLSDEDFIQVINDLIAKEEVKSPEVNGFYEEVPPYSGIIVTRYGIVKQVCEKNPNELLAELLQKELKQEDLEPDLEGYHGEFSARLWRMYQSGQFVHLFGCREDWFEEAAVTLGLLKYQSIKSGSILSILLTLYRITEIYEFASRLAQTGLFNNNLYVSIELHGMLNRQLVFLETGRQLFREYRCSIKNISYERKISVDEIVSNTHELALNHTVYVFERFNWFSPPKDVLREEQKKLLERRF